MYSKLVLSTSLLLLYYVLNSSLGPSSSTPRLVGYPAFIVCTPTLFANELILLSCTSLPIPILRREPEWFNSGLTLSLALTYYLPAPIGTKLRIVSTTKSTGKRAVTVYGEVCSPML